MERIEPVLGGPSGSDGYVDAVNWLLPDRLAQVSVKIRWKLLEAWDALGWYLVSLLCLGVLAMILPFRFWKVTLAVLAAFLCLWAWVFLA